MEKNMQMAPVSAAVNLNHKREGYLTWDEYFMGVACNTALGCTIQLGKDNTGYICNLRKLSGLHKCILTGSSIQDYQSLQISLRIFPLQNAVNLAKLFHKILLIMKSSCGITDQNVCIAGLGCCHCIINN